ncbi:MAG: twitching motility protein PilT [Spirochaetes bacterium RBG_13_51_14]|nr:MAG: twitching motility protein PilT [Spirochaetes bacterium RBG_13_51_14]
MILVDTSVLIDYFRGSSNLSTERFNKIRTRDIPFGINNYIYQELLQGAASERDFESLRGYLSTQRFYDLKHGRASHESAARLYFRCRKKGLTVRSTVDFIIIQTAIENNLMLLHNDSDFNAIAKIIKELKIY